MFIRLKHNMEIAHRLYFMPGKCQAIHGHSMHVELTLHGHPNTNGVFEGLDFADVKKRFRGYLDENFDHKLLLNERDPFAKLLYLPNFDQLSKETESSTVTIAIEDLTSLPGLVTVQGDPTTENLVQYIGRWSLEEFKLPCDIFIQETGTNGVGRSFR